MHSSIKLILYFYSLILMVFAQKDIINHRFKLTENPPDETVIKPCRSGTTTCMFGDCTKIWLRWGKHTDLIVECQCWPGYSGDWCQTYPMKRMPWRGLLRTQGKDEITPILQTGRNTRASLDTWHEKMFTFAGYLLNKHRVYDSDRRRNMHLLYHHN